MEGDLPPTSANDLALEIVEAAPEAVLPVEPEPPASDDKPKRKGRKKATEGEAEAETTPTEGGDANLDKPKRKRPTEKTPAISLNSELSLEALVESLLFVAEGAVPVARIAEALEIPLREVENALTTLNEAYLQNKRGLSLQRYKDKVQLTTSPVAAPQVERFLGLAATVPLSRAALETLAIIAYQQPVTRPQVDAVRGVNSDSTLKNLLTKGLIEETGKSEGPGRPTLYSTTPEFLQHFGLSAITELPPLDLEQMLAVPSEPESVAAEEILKG